MKKILIAIGFVLMSITLSAQLDTVNIGTSANSGDGDPLRTAFAKVNDAILLLNAVSYDSAYTNITDVRDEIADSLNAYRASAENLSDFVRLRTDTSIVSFGAGAGLAGDSVLFAQNMKCFGRFYIEQDTMQIMIARQTYISAGDSLKFNVYWGNAQTNTPVDSLFASPQASGEDQETWTTFNNDKIPPDVDVWPAISGTQIAGYRPYEWSFQLGYITIKQ